jgi:hypothetical protein
MKFDLDQLAKRLTDAAARAEGLEISISNFDLILAKDGHGTNRCESVPFAALFLSDKDVLGEALDRLGQGASPHA